MESFFSRYRNALVLIAVLIAQLIGLAVQVRRPGQAPGDKGSVRLIRSWVVDIVAPPERLWYAVSGGVRGVWVNYIDLIHVRQQNKDLRAELDNVRLEEESLAEDARQGQRLQALLGFSEKYIYKTLTAQVIGGSGTEQSQVLLIDKGANDGIRPDMPVITLDGIVGKTRDVFAHTSQVLEISDPTSGAGVILQKTRVRGVLRGNSWGQPEIVNVSPDDRIQPGEPVLTSGGDAIYPRGLAVGVVDRVVPDPDGTLVNVLIKPAANLAKLEEVLVITSTGDTMPQPMQQELSDAEQKASDVLAERLPSRVDPNAPADEQGDPAAQGTMSPNALPTEPGKPPQPVHDDRYSPGAVPSAADLVPGQKIAARPGPTAHAEAEPHGGNADSDDLPGKPAPAPKPKPKAVAPPNPNQPDAAGSKPASAETKPGPAGTSSDAGGKKPDATGTKPAPPAAGTPPPPATSPQGAA